MHTILVDLARGDCGKGRVADYLASKYDATIRYNGGGNAGHSIYYNNKLLVLHLLPSGILEHKLCIIGRGCVVNIRKILDEIKNIINFIDENKVEAWSKFKTKEEITQEVFNCVKISWGCHIIFPKYIVEDVDRENKGMGNGSTKQGIAQAYREKANRSGSRIYNIIKDGSTTTLKRLGITADEFNILKQITCDVEKFLNTNKLKYLFEGAQGILLDIDCPYYPNVSSSSVNIGGVISGTGISFKKLLKEKCNVVGIAKAYMSSVGVGNFLTEIKDKYQCDLKYVDEYGNNFSRKITYIAEDLRTAGGEFGATTGRPRKVGFLDIPLLRYSLRTTGVNQLCLTRLDTLMQAWPKNIFMKFPICVSYRHKQTGKIIDEADIWNLDDYEPIYQMCNMWGSCSMKDPNFKAFIELIEKLLKTKVKYISIGKNRNDMIVR